MVRKGAPLSTVDSLLPAVNPPSPRVGGLVTLGTGGPGASERADAARNRVRILEAARLLLKRKDIADLSMDEVADTAGVGKGTLYRRFADRAALCYALLDDSERALQDRVIAGLGLTRSAGAEARAVALRDALISFVVDNAPLLADAERHHVEPTRFLSHPVTYWRVRELCSLMSHLPATRHLPPPQVELHAHLLLRTLDPRLVLWGRANGLGDSRLVHAWQDHWARVLGLP